MNTVFFPVAAMCLLLCFLSAVPAQAQGPLRVIGVESGELGEYRHVLYGIGLGLMQKGFLKEHPPRADDTRTLWGWLGKHADTRLQFLRDGFYSAEWGNVDQRKELRQTIQRRIETQQDVDAILVFGTRVGQDMATMPTNVPVIVLSTTDAVGAGIVRSKEDSGRDNLIALISPWRFRRQVEFFHRIFPFNRLGIVYEDNPIGRNVVALEELEAAAMGLGVELVRCHARLHDKNPDNVFDNVETCHKTLVEQHVDAVYLTYNVALTPEQTRRTLAPLIKAGVPTFSQVGVDTVKCGALLGVVGNGIREGIHAAQILLNVRNGVRPRTISQYFQSPVQLAINLGTAARIGWNPPLEVLLSVDEFYE